MKISELQTKLREDLKGASIESKLLIEPIIQGTQIQLIILRFILLYVVLRLWSLAISAFNFLTGGIFLGIQTLNENYDYDKNKFLLYLFYGLSKLPEVAEWTITLGLGIPLFKDVNKI